MPQIRDIVRLVLKDFTPVRKSRIRKIVLWLLDSLYPTYGRSIRTSFKVAPAGEVWEFSLWDAITRQGDQVYASHTKVQPSWRVVPYRGGGPAYNTGGARQVSAHCCRLRERNLKYKWAQTENLTLSRTKNSDRYLAELINLPPGQAFLLFQPYPRAEPPPTRVKLAATLELTTPTVTEGSW